MVFEVVEELQVEVKHEPGALAQVLDVVAKAGVSVRAFAGYGMGPELGMVHLTPSDPKKAKAALKKAGFTKVQVNKVVFGKVKDGRGTAAKLAARAAAAGINIEATYATGVGKGMGMVLFATTPPKDARKLARTLS